MALLCHTFGCAFAVALIMCRAQAGMKPFVALGPQGNRAHGDTESKRNFAQGAGAPNSKRVRPCSVVFALHVCMMSSLLGEVRQVLLDLWQ